MAESSTQSNKLQWKWVGISFLSYVLLYLLPILIIGGFVPARPISPQAATFLGIWSFAGIIIIAALDAYLSPGITILEPAIAAVGLIVCVCVALVIFVWPRWFVSAAVGGVVTTIVIVFALSILGAWLGERVQKLHQKHPLASV